MSSKSAAPFFPCLNKSPACACMVWLTHTSWTYVSRLSRSRWKVNTRGQSPRLWRRKISYVWDGNYYALEVTTRLGLEESGGMVRVGAVHYNTLDEVARLG